MRAIYKNDFMKYFKVVDEYCRKHELLWDTMTGYEAEEILHWLAIGGTPDDIGLAIIEAGKSIEQEA